MSRMRRFGGPASSHTRRRAVARASRTFARYPSSRAAIRRQAVASEATGPKSTSWSRSAPRSQRASPPSASITARSRATPPGRWRPRRPRRSERASTRAPVSPIRSATPTRRAVPAREVKEPQSARTFMKAGGVVFFTFTVTSLCLGLQASTTRIIPAQEVTVMCGRALW
jgi:hypothetical protein